MSIRRAAFSSSHMAASSHLKSMPFKPLPSLPFLGRRLNPSIILGRSVNIAAPETMSGAPNSTTIGEKMAHLHNKFSRSPTFAIHEGSYSEGRSVNITVPAPTMSGARNNTLGGKMTYLQKLFLPLPTFLSHEGSYSEGRRAFHKTTLGKLTCPKLYVKRWFAVELGITKGKCMCFVSSHDGSSSEGRRGFHRTTLSMFANTKRLRHLVQVLRSASSNDHVESEYCQVFISFCGETRAGFMIHLHKALMQAGYNTFIDKEMKRGVNIDEELYKGIKNAELSVLVISPGHASSQSCLNELVVILYERRFGHKVLPLFFHVDPDEVGSLTGNFGAAFDGLVENLEDTTDDMLKVHCWKNALKEVAGISGLVLHPNQCQLEFIDQSLAWVKQLLNPPAPPRIASWPAFFYTCLQILASYCNKD